MDLIGPEMGQLDQELRKLAVYVAKSAKIEVNDVDELVGRGRTANAFKIFDALAEGKVAEGLAIAPEDIDPLIAALKQGKLEL